MKTAPATRTTSDRLTTVLSYGALLLLGYASFVIIEPFLVPLAWSAGTPGPVRGAVVPSGSTVVAISAPQKARCQD